MGWVSGRGGKVGSDNTEVACLWCKALFDNREGYLYVERNEFVYILCVRAPYEYELSRTRVYLNFNVCEWWPHFTQMVFTQY